VRSTDRTPTYDSGGQILTLTTINTGGYDYYQEYTWSGDQLLSWEYTNTDDPVTWMYDEYRYDCPEGIPPH
jgi:hypothetical protein